MSKLAPAVVGAVLLLSLTGCVVATPTPSAIASESSAPTPAPTPTVSAAPEPDYGFTFFEQAQLGSTFAQIGQQLHYPVGPFDGCPYYAPVWQTELAVTTAFTDSENPGGGVSFFYTNILLAQPSDPFPRNAEGIGIGSTQAEVLAAYPSATQEDITDLGAGPIHSITVEDPHSDAKYVFGITEGATSVDLLQWGDGDAAGRQWSHLCGGF